MQHFSPGETLKAQTGDWRAARKKYLTHGPAWHLHELPLDGMVLTPSQASLLSDLMADHAAGADLALVGEKGSGKSAIVRAFAALLGYRTRSLFCYRDMSSRDLLQRRMTDPLGNTEWRDSPIVEAAICGDLAILDGVHRLAKGSLYATLAPLLSDRACALPDGTFLCSPRFWEKWSEGGSLAALGARQVHPAFRLIVCGETPESGGPSRGWIDEEVGTLFHFHSVAALPSHEQRSLAVLCAGPAAEAKDKPVDKLLAYGQAAKAAVSKDADLRPLQLSLRALLRASRHLCLRQEDVAGAIARAFSARLTFLPSSQRQLGEKLLAEAGIRSSPGETNITSSEVSGELQLGSVRCQLRTPNRPELVPQVHFVQTPAHMTLLQSMLVSWIAGQHLLLVGNQGVGKNKLADQLLGLLRCEREYVQLHRDTTVQSLTLSPTLEARRAYYAAAGVDPDQIRNQMIDQMSDTDAALLGASDFFWDILVPFSAGAGLVYGIGITTGNLEGPFPQQEDGEQKS
eukprot:s563_g19.t1